MDKERNCPKAKPNGLAELVTVSLPNSGMILSQNALLKLLLPTP